MDAKIFEIRKGLKICGMMLLESYIIAGKIFQ